MDLAKLIEETVTALNNAYRTNEVEIDDLIKMREEAEEPEK